LVDRLSLTNVYIIFAPLISVTLIVREVVFSNINNAAVPGVHILLSVVEVVMVAISIAIFGHLFDTGTFTRKGIDFFRPRSTVSINFKIKGSSHFAVKGVDSSTPTNSKLHVESRTLSKNKLVSEDKDDKEEENPEDQYKMEQQIVHMALSRDMARFWNSEDLTWRTFFTFPDPVNIAEARIHAFCVTLLIPVSIVLDAYAGFPWVMLYILFGFSVRFLSGPRIDPQAHLVLFYLRPLFVDRLKLLENRFVPSSAQRFAQLCGIMFSLSGVVLRFSIPSNPVISYYVWGALWIATTLQCTFSLCLACAMFWMMVKVGIVNETYCEKCRFNFEINEDQFDEPSNTHTGNFSPQNDLSSVISAHEPVST